VFCKGGKDCSSTRVAGTWTPVYDQAIKADFENGLRFLANYKYNLKTSISVDPTKDNIADFSTLKSGDYNKFDS